MKLTDKHFKIFREECEYWIKELGLVSWKVAYEFKTMYDAQAECSWNNEGRIAAMVLSKYQRYNPCDVEARVRESARHECLELLLAPIDLCARSRCWDDVLFKKEKHTMIRTLEKALCQKRQDKK